MKSYREPILTYIVLDFCKPNETRLCLESIKKHTKFNHKVIYYHNGNGNIEYPYQLFKEGLIDQFIQTKSNHGLGIGTRDLVAACFSPYFFMLQNDQFLYRDFTEQELQTIIGTFGAKDSQNGKIIVSVSMAGSPCGKDVYSERGHIMATANYKNWENLGLLGYNGAGPYHDGIWREAQIQKLYKENNFTHFEWNTLIMDNGRTAMRENPDGSKWKHYPDTKQLFLLEGPVKEKFAYPYFTDQEWQDVLKNQYWEPGKIPEKEIPHSFHVWN